MNNNKEGINNLWMWVYRHQVLNSKNKEKGNTLIIAMSLGLIVLLATSVTLINSSKEKTNVQADEFTKQAIATTEAGITRTVSQLSEKYPFLLTTNYNPTTPEVGNDWSSPPSGDGVSPCAKSTASGGIVDLPNLIAGSLQDGNYTVKSYDYEPNMGKLTLQGLKNNSNNSKAQVEVEIEIEKLVPPNSFPGIYGETVISVGNNDLLGTDFNVLCSDCVADQSLLNCTADGEPSTAYLESAMGVGNNGEVEGNMVIGTPKLPPYPAPPSQACSSSSTLDCYIVINSISNDTTLPRPSDVTNRTTWYGTSGSTWFGQTGYLSKPYYYIVKHTGSGQKNSISGGILTINSSTAPVRMYVAGNVVMAGNSNYISHSGTLERFAIFGCTDSFNQVMVDNSISPTCISPYTDQTIKLNGQATATNVFVYAPNSTVGINGGGSFTAVVWANAWDMSSGNNATITVPDNAETLLTSGFGPAYGSAGIELNRIKSVKSWQRTNAN